MPGAPRSFCLANGSDWERCFLGSAAILTLGGYILVFEQYFMRPEPWSIHIEYWFYRLFPFYTCSYLVGGVIIMLVWLAGCILLCRRAWKTCSFPWQGIAFASLTPLLVLALNTVFTLLARLIPPLSVSW